jgi:hypothetical protein
MRICSYMMSSSTDAEGLFFDEPELSTSTSRISSLEFPSPLVLLHYLIDRVRLPLDRVELFARLAVIGA